MEMAFPHGVDFEVLNRPHQGKEVTGVVTIGLGRMVLQVDLPFFLHEGLQELLCDVPDPLLQQFFYQLPAGFVPYRGLPFFLFQSFLGRLPYCPSDTISEARA
mgnify:CR=1 FL=1